MSLGAFPNIDCSYKELLVSETCPESGMDSQRSDSKLPNATGQILESTKRTRDLSVEQFNWLLEYYCRESTVEKTLKVTGTRELHQLIRQNLGNCGGAPVPGAPKCRCAEIIKNLLWPVGCPVVNPRHMTADEQRLFVAGVQAVKRQPRGSGWSHQRLIHALDWYLVEAFVGSYKNLQSLRSRQLSNQQMKE
jgi:hypothetical protein